MKITDGSKGFIWLTVPKMPVHPFVENKVRNPEAIIPSILAKSIYQLLIHRKSIFWMPKQKGKNLKFGVGGIDNLSTVCVLSVIIFL